MTSGSRLRKVARGATLGEKLNQSAYGYYGATVAESSGDGHAAKGLKRVFAAALLSSTSVMAFGIAGAAAQSACPSTGPSTYVCSGTSSGSYSFSGDNIVVTGDATWDQDTTAIAPSTGANTAISITGEDGTARNHGSITTGVLPSAYSLYGSHHGLSVVATTGTATAENLESGTITTTAGSSHGLFAQTTTGAAYTHNDGTLYGSGDANDGMRSIATSTDGLASAENGETGVISMTGDWNTGMEARAYSGTATATNDGAIYVTGYYSATGINLSGETVTGINNGTIEVGAEYSVGMTGNSFSDTTTNLTNNGTIIATGDYGIGIEGSGPTVHITNAEGATITADHAGISVGYATGGSVANHGTITGDVSTTTGIRKRVRRRGPSDMIVRNYGTVDGTIDFSNATDTLVVNDGGTVGDGSYAIVVGYGTNTVNITGDGNDINGAILATSGIAPGGPSPDGFVKLDAAVYSATLNFTQDGTLVLDDGNESGEAVIDFDEINFVAGETVFSGTSVTGSGVANVLYGATITTDSALFSMGVSQLNVSGDGMTRGTLAAPAGSTIQVSGDVLFEEGGRFLVGVAGDGDAGSLYAEGGITFNEGSEIYADVTRGIDLTPGGDLLVATGATGGISDLGLSVYDNSILFDFTHEVRDSELYLTVERVLTALQATNNNNGRSNAESIADAIDAYLENAPTDNPIVVFLSQFPVEEQEEQLFKLVKDSLPSESNAGGNNTVVTSDMVLDLIMDRLNAGGFGVSDLGTGETGLAAGDQMLGGDYKLALWGRIGGSKAEYSPSGINGFDSDTFAATLGIDGEFMADLRTGLALFYTTSDVDENGAGANSSQTIDSYGALLYGTWRPADYYVTGTLGFSLNKYDSTRFALGGANVADYDGTQFMARIEGGRTFEFGQWEVTPQAGLRLNYVSIDAYTETGPLPTSVDEQNITSVRGMLGVGLRYEQELDNGAKLIPEFYLRGLEELADPNEAITGSIAGGGSFISQSEERDRFSVGTGVGLTYELDKQLSFRLLYDGEFQSDYQEHGLTAAIRFEF